MKSCDEKVQRAHLISLEYLITRKCDEAFLKKSPNLENIPINHHNTEISVVWLVERSAIKLLILKGYYGKTNVEVQRNFNASTILVALFEIYFRSLFFDVEKRRQCSKVTAMPWDLL